MAGCEVVAGGRWTPFSAAVLRRRLLGALLCGVSSNQRRKGEEPPALREAAVPGADRRSERLAELLRAEAQESECGLEAEKRRKIEALEDLQDVVRRLQEGEEGGDRRREDAAAKVRRLAKDNAEVRRTLAMLGSIPPLVGLLGSNDSDCQISAIYALLNLGIGIGVNKAAIVEAGAVHKMLALIESGPSPAAEEGIVANFLSLSAHDSNRSILGCATGAIPFLVKSFQSPNGFSRQSREDALRALLNLSNSSANAARIVNSGLVPCLLAAIGNEIGLSERSLSLLSNLVAASPEGRRALSRAADAFAILVDVLNWTDSPGCQEKAAYILMVMAHKSHGGDRAAMAAAGISSALLELTLIGSSLAQKRASRILEILREEKGKQVSEAMQPVSAPVTSCEGGDMAFPASVVEEEEGISEERRAVRRLVQQSLQSNMQRIARRANLPPEFAPSDRFRALTAFSTSKSLPF
ncbi:U-box domain-containing protein 12 [Apostasia shenzhenica]|uniref:U-box domain-containing protein 12 n=1 Tax=Apostasia shenzhenica TaxID=1088818 RepID=A0A2H9ZYB4_9ASPA|nr:U-box domain-containing protein 12 [Apostasia shenzhenica]